MTVKQARDDANNRIGKATVVAARTRPKFVGGARAIYDPELL